MGHAGQLLISMKKGTDGRTTLSCTRADGTKTWQRQEGAQAAFFPRHDLTHFAVESTLGHRQGFYGLVAAGWDLSDFGTPWPRGKLPAEGNLTEVIVGFFDQERSSGVLGSSDDLNALVALFCGETGIEIPGVLRDSDLWAVRQKRGELFSKWDAVTPGDALELVFDIEQ
jgi:hypothetical protein